MMRVGSVLQLRPEKLEEYKKYHQEVWPEVLKIIRDHHITNYSIFYRKGMLFSYFEYLGDDFDGDMAKIQAHPKTKEWNAVMNPMQIPMPDRKPDEWWSVMEPVFYME
jgi:L-rhamnose mutarotase